MAAHRVPTAIRARATAAAVALALTGAACSNNRVDSAEDDPFRAVAIGLCGELIDARVHAVWRDGIAASLRVLELAVGDQAPEPSEIGPLTEALTAYRDDFSITVEALAGLGPPEEFADDWETFVAQGTATLAALDARLAALADWDGAVDDVHPNVGAPPAVTAALEDLGLLDRDCATVLHDPGPMEGFEVWVTRAAEACSVVAERRLIDDYQADAELAAQALAVAVEGGTPAASDDLHQSLQRMSDEWRATYEGFAALDPAESPAPEEWQRTIDYSSQRADVYAARAEAAAAGDSVALSAALTATDPDHELGFGDFTQLGLASRDCRSVTP